MEINRIEADRHLIGVGRELESLDGKAKATLPVHVTEDGLWKLEAIANIRAWLMENLPEGVKVIA